MSMPRKIIDVYVATDGARFVGEFAAKQRENVLSQQPCRGDQVLFRFHLYASTDDTTAYAITAGSAFEFVIGTTFNATGTQIMLYSGDALFRATDWTGASGWSLTSGRVCCRADFDDERLYNNIGSTEDDVTHYCELVITPTPTSEGQHLTVLHGEITIRNDLYRAGTTISKMVVSPPSLNSSSSST